VVPLSEHEKRILRLFTAGKNSVEVAQELGITLMTLRNHLHRINLWARVYFCASVGAVDEETIQKYIERLKWDEEDQGFKITALTEP
jgi:REP element-mobilizing transposase RayT